MQIFSKLFKYYCYQTSSAVVAVLLFCSALLVTVLPLFSSITP